MGEIKARDIDNGKWNVSPSSALLSILYVGSRLLVVHCVESLSGGSWDADDAAALCQNVIRMDRRLVMPNRGNSSVGV